jgi:hypothetical protein
MDSSPTISSCTIAGNQADYVGGGIFCTASSPAITGCTITGNHANYLGGGIGCRFLSAPIIANGVIMQNSANSGGGIGIEDASPTVTCCTLRGNTADFGGGVFVLFSVTPPILTNSILWTNSAPEGQEIYVGEASLSVRYSDVQGGEGDVYIAAYGTLMWGEGNIDQDPHFLGVGDAHLAEGSPCIDAGDNSAPGLPPIDIDGQDRILDGDGDFVAIVDMGADEYKKTGYSSVANAEAAAYGSNSLTASGILNELALLLIPICAVIFLRILFSG